MFIDTLLFSILHKSYRETKVPVSSFPHLWFDFYGIQSFLRDLVTSVIPSPLRILTTVHLWYPSWPVTRDLTTPLLQSYFCALSLCIQATSLTFIDVYLFFKLQLWWTRNSVKHSFCQRFQNCKRTVVKYFSRLDISCKVCEPFARGWRLLSSVLNNRSPITSCDGVSGSRNSSST